jgi:hypothetical protein
MIKFYLIEEYRRHTSIAKKYSFFIFPLYIIFFVAVGASFINDIFLIFPYQQFISMTTISTFIYGFGVSSFEFLGRGKERASLNTIATYLPISQKRNYLNLFLRDIIYYTLLFLIPTIAGLLISIPFSNLRLTQITFFSITLFISMFLGYSLGYLSFSLWFKNRYSYYAFISSLLLYLSLSMFSLVPFPPANFQITKSFASLLTSVFLILTFSTIAYLITPNEIREISKRRGMSIKKYEKIFKNIKLAKEMEDVIRGGIIVKSIFTYFFPMLLLLIFIKIINLSLGKDVYNPMSIAVMLSIFSAVIYSWLTIVEDFGYFETLPLKASDLIKTHMIAYLILISVISIPIIVGFTLNSPNLLPASLGLFYLNSIYLLSITAYITGPKITSLLFNPGIVMKFSVYSIVPGMILVIGTFKPSFYSIISVGITAAFMIILTIYNFKRIEKKWVYF